MFSSRRRRRQRTTTGLGLAVLSAVTVAALLAAAPASAADEPATPEGRGIALPSGYESLGDLPSVQAEKPLNDALDALHALYAEKYLAGGAGAATAQADGEPTLDERIAEARAEVERVAGRPYSEIEPEPDFSADASTTSDSDSDAQIMAATQKALPVRHSTQRTSYYCGPASVAMAIRASCSACERSRYNSSDTISQTTLAASRYLATTTSGTNMSRIPLTLNRWAGFASRLVSSPSAASIKSGVVNSIGVYNRAVVYGTRELAGAGNPHYNYHYTTFTIDHLIMGYGYSGSGDRLAYADPVAGRWTNTGQSKAPQKTNAMRNTSMRIFTQPWGVVL
jgi:hypothetical protein